MFAKSFHFQATLVNNHKGAHFQAQNHINLPTRDPIMHFGENRWDAVAFVCTMWVSFVIFLVDSLEMQSVGECMEKPVR